MGKRRQLSNEPVEEESRLPAWAALAIVAVVLVAAVAAGVGMSAAASPAPGGKFARCQTGAQVGPRQFSVPPPMCIDTRLGYSADINTTKGKISVVLLVSRAPSTVNNFIVLAVNGYYTGLPFWRVEDWVVQTGDPRGDGRGGPGYSLADEPAANDPAAKDPWVPGSLGFARPSGGPLNGGQFFITKTAWPGGSPSVAYNHFATVTLGFDIVQQLTAGDRVTGVTVRQAGSPSPSPSASASPSP